MSKPKMKSIKVLFTVLLLLLSTFGFAQAITNDDKYRAKVQEALQLDYSMPDYTTSKIDAKVMGPRLAAILNKIMESRGQQTTIATLSVIQTRQVEGLSYDRIKDLKLDKVIKQGDELTISYITTLENNNLHLKKTKLVFRFINGVSDDAATNDFFSNICRYIKE